MLANERSERIRLEDACVFREQAKQDSNEKPFKICACQPATPQLVVKSAHERVRLFVRFVLRVNADGALALHEREVPHVLLKCGQGELAADESTAIPLGRPGRIVRLEV